MSEEKQKIEPGTHKVKVRNWGLRETKSEKVQAYIGFSNGATMFQMVGVSEIGDEIIARALTLCGFKGSDLLDLFDDKALDKNREVEIFVKYKPDNEGKPQMNVYVNDLGKVMTGALDKKSAFSKLKDLKISLKKEFKMAQSDIELPQSVSKSEPVSEDKFDESEIPF